MGNYSLTVPSRQFSHLTQAESPQLHLGYLFQGIKLQICMIPPPPVIYTAEMTPSILYLLGYLCGSQRTSLGFNHFSDINITESRVDGLFTNIHLIV